MRYTILFIHKTRKCSEALIHSDCKVRLEVATRVNKAYWGQVTLFQPILIYQGEGKGHGRKEGRGTSMVALNPQLSGLWKNCKHEQGEQKNKFCCVFVLNFREKSCIAFAAILDGNEEYNKRNFQSLRTSHFLSHSFFFLTLSSCLISCSLCRFLKNHICYLWISRNWN